MTDQLDSSRPSPDEIEKLWILTADAASSGWTQAKLSRVAAAIAAGDPMRMDQIVDAEGDKVFVFYIAGEELFSVRAADLGVTDFGELGDLLE